MNREAPPIGIEKRFRNRNKWPIPRGLEFSWNRYECHYCLLLFEDGLNGLDIHQASTTNHKVYHCCGITFPNKELIRNHIYDPSHFSYQDWLLAEGQNDIEPAETTRERRSNNKDKDDIEIIRERRSSYNDKDNIEIIRERRSSYNDKDNIEIIRERRVNDNDKERWSKKKGKESDEITLEIMVSNADVFYYSN
jgi:5-methylcytosine-specific restriction endonuclease McrA